MKIIVERPPFGIGSVKVFLVQVSEPNSFIVSFKDGIRHVQEIKPVEVFDQSQYTPIMEVEERVFDEVMRQLIDQVKTKPTKDESILEGELRATKLHLSDLQRYIAKLLKI